MKLAPGVFELRFVESADEACARIEEFYTGAG
jgi:hypothetical protein